MSSEPRLEPITPFGRPSIRPAGDAPWRSIHDGSGLTTWAWIAARLIWKIERTTSNIGWPIWRTVRCISHGLRQTFPWDCSRFSPEVNAPDQYGSRCAVPGHHPLAFGSVLPR
jgi:hypothetical protein